MNPKRLSEILAAVRVGTMTMTEASKQIDRIHRQEVERRTSATSMTTNA
jgi:hypothetical protein